MVLWESGETSVPFIVKCLEETGIRMKNIHYFGSQCISNSQMVGFLADKNCMMHNGFPSTACQNYRQPKFASN